MQNTETQTFSLRPATEDDLAAILAIERASYPVPWTEDAFRIELQKPFSKFLVCTDDQTDSLVVGYIVYWLHFDECHILNVSVHLDWRGLGFAVRFVRQAIQDAVKADMKRVFLEVRKSNAAGIGLYQKLGFYVDHIKKNFYENGEDAYFMTLHLDRKNAF